MISAMRYAALGLALALATTRCDAVFGVTLPPIDRACRTDADCATVWFSMRGNTCHVTCSDDDAASRAWVDRARPICDAHWDHVDPGKCSAGRAPVCRAGSCEIGERSSAQPMK